MPSRESRFGDRAGRVLTFPTASEDALQQHLGLWRSW